MSRPDKVAGIHAKKHIKESCSENSSTCGNSSFGKVNEEGKEG
jgi:hypothetical protein